LSAQRITDLLNTFGVVVIQFEEEEPAHQQLLCFKELFGNTMSHDRAGDYDIAEIAVSKEFDGYLGTSSLAHPFHTDGTYSEHPPKIVALRCQVPARKGGVTQLASGKKLYEWLLLNDKTALESLRRNDALSVDRAGKSFSGAVFKDVGNRLAIRYRTDGTAHFSESADVQRGIKLIQDFLSDEKSVINFQLESRQVLITDNLSVLHGRTAFDSEDPRQMHRLFFDGAPRPDIGLCPGFTIDN
jgi:alpha-ketoglutarate-dependent taurine dioxygenase